MGLQRKEFIMLKLVSFESVMPSNHLIFCCPLLLLPSIFPSVRIFSELVLRISLPNYWSFSFIISPSNEYSGLISFRIDQFDLLAVQGTLKSLLQHHSSEASILGCSAFFMVQLSWNRLSCRDQEGRRGSEEAVPGPSVFPSGVCPGPNFPLQGRQGSRGCIPDSPKVRPHLEVKKVEH